MSKKQEKKPVLTAGMKKLLKELEEITNNPVVEAAFNNAIANVTPILPDGKSTPNPWTGKTIDYLVDYFKDWFTFLPSPTGGLGKIMPFTYFYLENPEAFYFLNDLKSRRSEKHPYSKEIFNWSVKFIKERGKFMDSKASLYHIEAWIKDPSTKIEDFVVPKGGFQSFNQFFTRNLKMSKNPRPISDPKDDSVVVSPADSEINFIESDLTLRTLLKVKTRQINVSELLGGSKLATNFLGGTAVSCVLMPNSYHHFHSPVNGKVVESRELKGIYNGIMDGEDWFNTGNIGESTTDFSIFEDFHRAYYVIETKKYGHVAMITVGLNTISAIHSTLINKKSTMVKPGGKPVKVQKGEELGYFAYGGSLNILLFEKGAFSSVSLLMGQRIGSLTEK
jgi:phosphatidylserine decarboxylase